MGTKTVVVTLSLLALINRSLTTWCACYDDLEFECDPPSNCSYGLTHGFCSCCDDVCAKGPGESCWVYGRFRQSCSKGFYCKNENGSDGEYEYGGVCVPNCSYNCTADWDPVCGSDGTTYDNECQLKYARCRNSDNIDVGYIAVAYKGECHDCPADWSPVCGSDGTTYDNECLLSYASCRNHSDNIVVAHKGICPSGNLCPEGYFSVGKQCFKVNRGRDMTWNDAQEECKKEGGLLAEPISIPDFHKVIQSQYNDWYGFWLGGSDRKQEGVWRWSSDGTLVGNSGSWYTGEPSNAGGEEHCMFIETKRNPPLDDRPCHHSYRPVCEKRQIIDDNCSSICTADWRPAYGSDGNTYSNECRLNYASCMKPSDNIVVAHKGKCHGNCSGFCWAHYSPVCGSDGNTYSNECRLNYASCMNPSDNIVVAHKGKCLHPGTCPPSHKECTDSLKGLSVHISQICSKDDECSFHSKCCFDKCLDHHTCKPAQDIALPFDRK